MSDDDQRLEERLAARRLWTVCESVHAVVYFHPTALAALEAAGLRGFWRGYFAQRAAPLGPVGEAPVRAAFFGFSPSMTTRALPAVWDLVTPETALAARADGAAATLAELGATSVPPAVVDRLWALAATLPCDGRVLGAANQALPRPDEPLRRLWQACTTLREHRGDGHVAALVTAGLSGLESLVLRAGADLDRQGLQRARGWTDDAWSAAVDGLHGRGLLDGDARVTPAAVALLADVEHVTDTLAADAWRRAGGTVAEAGTLRTGLLPTAAACRGTLPAVNPIGLPEIGG